MNMYDMPLEELREYKPEIEKKGDFERFWEDALAESAAQAINASMERVPYPVDAVECFTVKFDGFGANRMSARYVRPRLAPGATSSASRDAAKLPSLVAYHGYNWNTLTFAGALKYALMGRSVLLMDVRGQDVGSPDHARYPNGGASGWMTLGIVDPKSYYYRNVYLDSVRAVELVRSFPETDGSRIAVEGGSQGGALALAVGALSPHVSAVLSDVPYLCHFRRAVKLSTEGPYNEIYHYFKIHDSLHETEAVIYGTLSYFDCCNLAVRIKGECLLAVGLEDTICPPSTIFAAYNRIRAPKNIRVYPDFGHGGFARHDEEKIAFLAKR
jgi:cephalosporin-C deacetylase